MKPTTLFAIYLLDFVLPHVLLPAANWVLELQDIQDQMKSSLNLSYSYEDIMKFQSEIARLFYFLLKENIQNHFSSQDVVTSVSILILNYIQNHQIMCMGMKKPKHFCITMAENNQPRQVLVSSVLCQLPSPLIF